MRKQSSADVDDMKTKIEELKEKMAEVDGWYVHYSIAYLGLSLWARLIGLLLRSGLLRKS